MPDPSATFGDADYVRARWLADPAASLGAELDGDLVASNLVTRWGSIGVFGPLTVRPDLWDRGIAKRLMDATVDILDAWGVRLGGLFTFAHSGKHIGLYHRYGFWPQHLTFVMARPTSPAVATSPCTVLSATPPADRPAMVAACREIADLLYADLDVSREIEQVDRQNLGDTVVVADDAGLVAFGVCHIGAGSEAGGGVCYVKFGAVRPGPDAGRGFERLLDARTELAARRGAQVLLAGANTGRTEAWAAMIERGFRSEIIGVVMHRPNDPGYSIPGRYIIDDWR